MSSANTVTLRVLAVDLDGTLLRTDMLHESFWSALSHNWMVPLIAVRALCSGRARLKQHLDDLADIDVALLPFDEEVVSYVRRWREAGGRTVLVTASNQALADRIARHFGIFDEVFGSDGITNLKGPKKAEFLVGRYGSDGFAYVGDSSADLPVWQESSKIITVGLNDSLKRRVEALVRPIEHLSRSRVPLNTYFRTLRPHQWLKNVLVFLPMLAAHQINIPTLSASMLAFIAFSLIASSVYVMNDLLDLSADRAHPRKRNRPFASGALPISHGPVMIVALLVAGCSIALALGLLMALTIAAYCAATTAYSFALKRLMIVDICVLAGLYTVRIVAGGAATGIPLSVWLLAFSMFFFFSLAAVKRQAELVDGAASGIVKLRSRGYRVADDHFRSAQSERLKL